MTLWTPAAIATGIWLDAADSSTLYDAVSGGSLVAPAGRPKRWEDKSGNGIHATQATYLVSPTYTAAGLNGLNVVSFGSGSWIDLPENSWSIKPVSTYIVFLTTTTAGASFALSARDPNRWYAPYIDNGNFHYRLKNTSFYSVANTLPNVHGVISGTSAVSAYKSGGLVGTAIALTGDLTTGRNNLGSYSDGGGSGLSGYIAEVIVCHEAHSAATRQVIEGYLHWKWGLQANLPVDHPYKNAAPLVGKYDVNGKKPVSVWIPSRDTAGNGTTTLTDLVGSNNGTLTSMDPATDWVVSDGKTALDFDGSNDYVQLTTAPITNYPFTITGWFRQTTAAYGAIFGIANPSLTNRRWSLEHRGPEGRVMAVTEQNGGSYFQKNSANSYTLGVWTFAAGIFASATDRRVYMLGQMSSSDTRTNGPVAGISSASIGAIPTSPVVAFMNGQVDDVRIWNQELNLADLYFLELERGRQWKVEPFDVNGKKPVAVWCESRDPEPTSSTVVTDLIGTNNGTMTNMDPVTDRVADTAAGGIRALDFDRVNDVVVMGPPPITQQMSQSYWFKRGQINQFGPFAGFGRAGDVSNRFVIWPWSDGKIYAVIGSFNSADFVSNDLNWHHILCSFDGTATGNANRLKVWFDGNPVSLNFSGTIGSSIGTPTLTRLGQTPGNDVFGLGRADDYRIFNQALSAADAAYLYDGGFGRGIRASVGSSAAAIQFFHGF